MHALTIIKSIVGGIFLSMIASAADDQIESFFYANLSWNELHDNVAAIDPKINFLNNDAKKLNIVGKIGNDEVALNISKFCYRSGIILAKNDVALYYPDARIVQMRCSKVNSDSMRYSFEYHPEVMLLFDIKLLVTNSPKISNSEKNKIFSFNSRLKSGEELNFTDSDSSITFSITAGIVNDKKKVYDLETKGYIRIGKKTYPINFRENIEETIKSKTIQINSSHDYPLWVHIDFKEEKFTKIESD